MKKVFICAALCSAAAAFAGTAHADDNNNGFLSESSQALILGATGVPTPDAAYISAATDLYLDPNGYLGTAATTLPLTTPGGWDFFQSVPEGQEDLVNAVVAAYNAGDMECTASGVCSDPLTIFTYSQSSLVASLAQSQLAEEGIPSDALRFVMVGANPLAVPDDLYPTTVYNIVGDWFADPRSVGNTFEEIIFGMLLHNAYLGLTPDQIDAATPVVDGMTTVYEIPTLTGTEMWEAFFNVLLHTLGL